MTVWWSKAVLIGAVIAAALMPLGALGYKFGVLQLPASFAMLGASALLAAALVVLGVWAWIAAGRKGLSGDRSGIGLGLLVSVLIVAFVALQYSAATSVPPIHNITTDTSNPPAFDQLAKLRAELQARSEGINPIAYDAEANAKKQTEAYPQLATLTVPETLAPTVAAAEAVLREMGLEVVNVDADAGRLEATATTFWFGFKDDVVVRVQDGRDGSEVDVRSVSRVGVSDLGANAARISEFLALLQARLG